MLTDIQAVVLAAGKSTRFNTGNSKLLETVCGQEIILYPLSLLDELHIPTTVITGFQKHKLKELIEKKHNGPITFLEQSELNGTAGGLKLFSEFKKENVLALKADTPLLQPSLIEKLYRHHKATDAAISLLTAHNGDPSGYCYNRVVQENEKIFIYKPQELNASQIQEHCCISGGVYLIARSFLEKELPTLQPNSTTKEYHISDLVNLASQKGYIVSAVKTSFDQIRSATNHQELWAIEQIKRAELIKYWMDRGVRFCAAQTVHMDLNISIGAGTFIGGSVHLLNGSTIGSQCTVGPFSIIDQSTIGDHTTIHSHTTVTHAIIGSHVELGPFANIQEQSHIGDHCVLGNFVETKRMDMGNYSKAKHLSYLADAHIGSHVNIGAGTITCNYDGKEKHTTIIEDYAFIGSHNSLVAPVTIKTKSFTAAGSTITHDVPAHALGIARARQVNKEQYTSIEVEGMEAEVEKEPLSFMGAYKTTNDTPSNNQ